jgi:hypothetical protein
VIGSQLRIAAMKHQTSGDCASSIPLEASEDI